MSAGQFDTPETMKEWRKAEIAQLEADCNKQQATSNKQQATSNKQEAEGYTGEAAKNKVAVARLKRQYQKDYNEEI